MTRALPLLFVVALATVGLPATARTLDLAFLPPAVEPQDLCLPSTEDPPDDLDVGEGEEDLTDELRLRYIIRDTRRLQAEDADRWFDFLMTLIDWRARLDPVFAGTDADLAKIGVYIDAGRLEALQAAGLIARLRAPELRLTFAQKMIIAQFYLNGIGVAQDIAYAHTLIRDAAYGGNPDALLAIARMDLTGQPMPEWDAPLDLTVTLAFGGLLGQMNPAVCGHAERIAREYLNGEIVTRNPDIAQAWYRFAADLGGGQAAWRVVEFHLNAPAGRKDNDELLKYLKLAVARGITLEDGQISQVKSAGAVDEATLREILGFNVSQDKGRGRPSISHYLQLSVNLDSEEADESGPYLEYLREASAFATAPGWVFTRLANEVMTRRGRWAAEAEAMALLEQAVLRDDPEGMQLLAEMLIRYRDDPAQLNRAINLLTDAVERHGLMSAMTDLDGLYRCQAPDAPRLAEADLWATSYRATEDETVDVSPGDLISLDPYKKPEMLAMIQSQAMDSRPESLANFLQRRQLDPFATDASHRIWTARANASDKTLELFAILEFALAGNPSERDIAVELFRRVYLNNGVTTALDLSVALTEDNGRDPAILREVQAMLTQAGNRGEGNSIRLKWRTMADSRAQKVVYDEFAQVIEERGDFLALMFAIPFVDSAKAQDYLDRAVSIMVCGTKDVDELGDATAILRLPELTDQWRRIGLTIEWGHVLAKLAISDAQMALQNDGAAPTARQVLERNLAEGDEVARRNLFTLTADPDLPSYDPKAAAGHLLAILASGLPDDEGWVLETWRKASPDLRAAVEAEVDIVTILRSAAERGDVAAKLDLALALRATAKTQGDLAEAARWMKGAAEGGSVAAMAELGGMLVAGIGGPEDRPAALSWLDQAAMGGDAQAAETARLLRLGTAP